MQRFPHSTRDLESRPIEYGPRDWEDKVPRVDTTRELQRLLPEISRIAANHITRVATKSDYRVAYFNLMSVDDFRNDDFEELCQFICDLTQFEMEEGTLRDPERGMERRIEDAVSLHSSSLSEVYRELDDLVEDLYGTNAYNAIKKNTGAYHTVCDAIDDMKRNSHRDQRGRSDRDDQDYRRDSRYRDDRDDRDDRYRRQESSDRGRSRDDRYGRREDPRSNQRNRDDYRDSRNDRNRGRDDRYYRDSRYDRDPRGGSRQRDDLDSRLYRPRERAKYETDYRSRQEAALNHRPGDSDIQIITSDAFSFSDDDWGGADAFIQARKELSNKGTRDGEVEKVVQQHKLPTEEKVDEKKETPVRKDMNYTAVLGNYYHTATGKLPLLIPEGKTEMDIFQHERPYIEGSSQTPDLSGEIVRTLSVAQAKDMKDATASEYESNIISDPEPSLHSNISSLAEYISNLATIRSVEAAPENVQGVRKIFRKTAVVHTSIVGHRQLNEFHRHARECTTLKELLDFLKNIVEATANKSTPESAFSSDIRAAADLYDRHLTREINDYCVNILSIAKEKAIDSAVSDTTDLIVQLHQAGMTMQADALQGFLGRMTINICDGWGVDAKELEEMIRADSMQGHDTESELKLGITYLAQSYDVTHLPFTMKELGYDIDKVAVIPDDKVAPILRSVLEYDADKSEKTSAYMECPNRLLVTRDRSVFRVSTYPNNPKVIILSRIQTN